MSSVRSVLQAARSDRRLLVVATVVASLEVAVRLGLGTLLDPHFGTLWVLLAVLLTPPVITVFGLAAVSSSAREMVVDADDWTEAGFAPQNWSLAGLLGRRAALAAVAVVGHGFAVGGGFVGFLLVDTPVRFALYWGGYGEVFTFNVLTYSPFVGIGLGTIVAWTIPAIAVVEIGNGTAVTAAVRTALTAAISVPRSVGTAVLGHFAFLVGVVGVAFVAVSTTDRIGSSGLEIGGIGVAVLFVLGGLTLAVGAGAWLATSVAFIADRFAGPSADGRLERSVPVVRLLLVVLVVTALVGTAGAVRTNEVRPMDASPDPLPDDPDGIYATAFANTDRTSHEYRWLNETNPDADPIYEFRIDRADRQLTTSFEGVDGYFSTGTFSQGQPAPLPGYAMMTSEVVPRLGEPSPDADNWTVVDERDAELTLELSDPVDVADAFGGIDLEDQTNDPEVHDSRARVIVDTERATLSRGELRLNVSDPALGDGGYDAHTVFEYEIGTDVDRPDKLGSPSMGERLWRLLAY
ncbi:hypothetical protein GS429_02900 [Natronorubrum sp. JWXQ-INN-674]|uniref:Uncharacterized protein n=1 Tax=Natronorubrum halalkaliphilum TaxID=2691917 RepID=A0A6B0VIB8_9EURY|nr:hypothetical protein [Natronorubrum halalkaliphilum]MXV61023.1 hypothetical protein [Natronorubrum halalkaliphilum]